MSTMLIEFSITYENAFRGVTKRSEFFGSFLNCWVRKIIICFKAMNPYDLKATEVSTRRKDSMRLCSHKDERNNNKVTINAYCSFLKRGFN